MGGNTGLTQHSTLTFSSKKAVRDNSGHTPANRLCWRAKRSEGPVHSKSPVGRPSSLALAGNQSRGGAPDQRPQPKSEMQNHLVPKRCIAHFILSSCSVRRWRKIPTPFVHRGVLCHLPYAVSLVGLVVNRPPSIAADVGSIPAFPVDLFRGRVKLGTEKLELQWLPCQAPGVLGSLLGLAGPVSVYYDCMR